MLLCVFTAKAANIIGRMTFHSALSLKVGTSICHMGDKTKAKLRHHFADLKLLIIDEVSMVGANMLYRIHLTLNKPWGGGIKPQPVQHLPFTVRQSYYYIRLLYLLFYIFRIAL